MNVTSTKGYRLVAEGPGGTIEQSLKVIYSPAAPTIAFSAEPRQIRLGESSTLSWKVTGASDIHLDPDVGSISSSGNWTIRPLRSTAYILRASGPGGTTQSSALVTVAGIAGTSSGRLVWSGTVNGIQLITIDRDHADVGTLQGALPGLPCSVQPTDEKKVAVVVNPSPSNNFDRLVLRVTGRGNVQVRLSIGRYRSDAVFGWEDQCLENSFLILVGKHNFTHDFVGSTVPGNLHRRVWTQRPDTPNQIAFPRVHGHRSGWRHIYCDCR